MRACFGLLKREIRNYLTSPTGWVIWTLFLLGQGYGFYLLVEMMAGPKPPSGAVMRLFFGGTAHFWLLMLVLIAALTMRLIAEERRSGCMELLLTAPVTPGQIVVTKYAAACLYYVLLWLPTVTYALIAWRLQIGSSLDWGPVLSSYVGVVLIGASGIAVGVFCSALAKSQIVAAMLTCTTLIVALLVEPLGQYPYNGRFAALIDYVSVYAHMRDFARGIIDSRRIVFHTSVIALSLFAARRAVDRVRL